MFQNKIELMIDPHIKGLRGAAMMRALADTIPTGGKVTTGYSNQGELLVLYGIGKPERTDIAKRHMAAGGQVACWDLGYWDREESLRLAFNGYHPTAEHLALAPSSGCRKEFVLREDANPEGSVLLIGLGAKSGVLYGLRPMQWEATAFKRIAKFYPDRKVVWRPKGRYPTPFKDLEVSHGFPIEEALVGKSLVVCRHSNVAVDACIAGVPVWCDDGAALAIYKDVQNPDRETRAEFLRQLGWWNWSPAEAPQAWSWIEFVFQSLKEKTRV